MPKKKCFKCKKLKSCIAKFYLKIIMPDLDYRKTEDTPYKDWKPISKKVKKYVCKDCYSL